ncbi:interleukin-31 receptor subunit alpha-like isoform X1 [Petromyzon marinus]|uniref:interleukin-31 receptor subunit alpha-like isoform X1 n=2 Tax=Petromyzon marinus TaxID=7757 RepID=UPI003F703E08
MTAPCMQCSVLCLVLHVSTASLMGIIFPDPIVLRVGSPLSAHCLVLFATPRPSDADAEPCTSSHLHWSLNGTRLPGAAHRTLNATASELLVNTSEAAGPASALLFPGKTMLTCTMDCPFHGLQTLYGVEVHAGYPPWEPRAPYCESAGVNGNMSCTWEPGGKTFLSTSHILQYHEHGLKRPWIDCVSLQDTAASAAASATSTSCTLPREKLLLGRHYDFRVVAHNALGHAESAVITTSRRQTVKTDAPVWEKPILTEGLAEEVTLRWSPPPNDNYEQYFPLQYELSVTSHADGTTTKYSNIHTNSRTYSLFSLRPYSSYTARLRCTFESSAVVGKARGRAAPPPVWSEWSKQLNFTTPEAAPLVAPELWRIPSEPDKMGNQVTTLVWKALNKSLARGEILDYRLVCSHTSKKQHGGCEGAGKLHQEADDHGEGGGDDGGRECSGSLWRLDATRRSLTVRTPASAPITSPTERSRGTAGALVWLWVCNNAGASPVAHIRIAARKPQRGPLRESLTLDVQSGGDKRLVVKWRWLPPMPPPMPLKLSGWALQVCHPCEEACTEPRWWRLPANARSAPIESVVRGQCYAVSLCPIMADASVGAAVYKRAYSAEEAPSAGPGEIYVREGKTSAMVSWKPLQLADQRGILLDYSINVRSASNKFTTLNVSGNESMVMLPNLTPSSKYTVSVWARNGAGRGPPSTEYTFSTLAYDVGELEAIVVIASLLGLFFLVVIMLVWGKVQGRFKELCWPNVASPKESKALKGLVFNKQASSEPISPVSQNSWICDAEPNIIQTEEEFPLNFEEPREKCPPEQTSLPTPHSNSNGGSSGGGRGRGSGDDEPYSSISLVDHGAKSTPLAPAAPILPLPPPPQSVRRYINTVAPSYENLMGGDGQWPAACDQPRPGGSQQRENEFGGSGGGNVDVGAGYGRRGIFSGGGDGCVGNGGVGVSGNGNDGDNVFGGGGSGGGGSGGGGGGRRDMRHVELFVDMEKVLLLDPDTAESPTEPGMVMSYLPQSVKDPGYMPQ